MISFLRPSKIVKVCSPITHSYNSFGLVPGLTKEGGTCPNATCKKGGCYYTPPNHKNPICYAIRICNFRPNIKQVLHHNTDILTSTKSVNKLTNILNAEFDRFRSDEEHKAANKKSVPWLYYRLHWSGDIFNKHYAEALSRSIQQNNDITFWTYTRSFFAVPYFSGVQNLILYLSLDPVNVQVGLECYESYRTKIKGLRISYMGQDKNNTLQLSPCPSAFDNFKLEGSCFRCKKCIMIDKKINIWFKP